MLRVNNLVGFGSGGKSTNITGTNTSNNGSNDNTGTYNFSSMSVGAEASDRLIVCVIGWSNNASLTSATILGVTATEHIEMSNQSHCSALISAAVPTGTSGTISFSISPNGTRAQVTVYRLVGQLDNTPYDTDSSDSAGATSLSTSVNVVNRGLSLAV